MTIKYAKYFNFDSLDEDEVKNLIRMAIRKSLHVFNQHGCEDFELSMDYIFFSIQCMTHINSGDNASIWFDYHEGELKNLWHGLDTPVAARYNKAEDSLVNKFYFYVNYEITQTQTKKE